MIEDRTTPAPPLIGQRSQPLAQLLHAIPRWRSLKLRYVISISPQTRCCDSPCAITSTSISRFTVCDPRQQWTGRRFETAKSLLLQSVSEVKLAFGGHIVGGLGIGLVEHDAFVTGALEHCRQRHDSDRRESHYPNVAVFGSLCRGHGVELWIANVNEENQHAFRPQPRHLFFACIGVVPYSSHSLYHRSSAALL